MIIVFGGQKGGIGKSTHCVNKAVELIQQGRDPIIMDTNYPQNSSCLFGIIRDSNKIKPRIPVLQKMDESIDTEIEELQKKYSDVLIDAGGYDSTGFRSSIAVADIIVSPIEASTFSSQTIPIINNIVHQARAFNRKLKAFLFINKAPTNASLVAREVIPTVESIKSLALIYQFCETIIYDRVVYRDGITSGKGILELSSDDKASKELKALYKEIFND